MKPSFPLARALLLTIRTAFGLVFLCASFNKIVDPEAFAQQVANYDIIGPNQSAMVAAGLPWAEFVIGSCLLVRICAAGAWLATIILSSVFLYAKASVLHRGLSIECGCGVMDGVITIRSVIVSAALCVTSIAGYAAEIRSARRPEFSPDPAKKLLIPQSASNTSDQPAEVASCV